MIQEIDAEKAWRIIHAMQKNPNFYHTHDHAIIIRLSCYLSPSAIHQHLKRLGYHVVEIKKFKKPFPFNLLPIPSPHYFYLYDVCLNRIQDLAWSCNQFMMFEILMVDRSSMTKIKEMIIQSEKTLYNQSFILKDKCKEFFMCGFDFDDPDYHNGVSQVVHYNFIPIGLSIYL